MSKMLEKIYKDIEIVGFYNLDNIYKNTNTLEEFKSKALDATRSLDEVYTTIKKHNLPIIDRCHLSFVEGGIQFIYTMSLFKTNDGNPLYDIYELNDIVRELTKLLQGD